MDIHWSPARPVARLFSWTSVNHVFGAAYAAHVPILLAMVTPLDAENVRLVVNLIDLYQADLQIGMLLTAQFRPALIAEHIVPWFGLPA